MFLFQFKIIYERYFYNNARYCIVGIINFSKEAFFSLGSHSYDIIKCYLAYSKNKNNLMEGCYELI